MQKIKTIVVDDHPIVLAGLTDILSNSGEVEVIGTGKQSDDIISLLEKHPCDLLVTDLGLPGPCPFGVIHHITQRFARLGVVIFTANAQPQNCIKAIDAGARGYVLKGSSCEQLLYGIRDVSRGGTFISSQVGAMVIREQLAARARTKADVLDLTARQEQVVKELLQGRTNKEIARTLNLTDKTVKHYMTQILQKLGVRNRLEAVLSLRNQMMENTKP